MRLPPKLRLRSQILSGVTLHRLTCSAKERQWHVSSPALAGGQDRPPTTLATIGLSYENWRYRPP
jgi:hypothetical protein